LATRSLARYDFPVIINYARIGGVALAVLGGAGVAAQSRINGALAGRLHSGVGAAVVSFGSGLIILTIGVLLFKPARTGLSQVVALLGKGELRWWECAGGACGAFLVATQGLTVGSLGVALFTVAIVAGQSVSSLLVDRAGLAPGGVRPITVTRAIGTALTVAAVVLAVSGRLGTPAALGLAVLPVLAGAGSAWQQAMNGRVRQASEGVVATTFINFLVGTAALLITFGIWTGVDGAPTGSLPGEPWYYVGGTLGIIFIAIAAALVRHIGVLLLGLGMIAGQVGGAVLLDVVTPAGTEHLDRATLAGAALTLVAVGIASIPGVPRRA
jgi:bacterial/archaeal transporter family-2 protein